MLVEGNPKIDIERLKRIRELVDIPLVIHGGTGFPDEAVRQVIKHGVAKFNVGTILRKNYWDGLKSGLNSLNDAKGYLGLGNRRENDLFSIGSLKVKNEVKRLLRVYGSAGKARQ